MQKARVLRKVKGGVDLVRPDVKLVCWRRCGYVIRVAPPLNPGEGLPTCPCGSGMAVLVRGSGPRVIDVMEEAF